MPPNDPFGLNREAKIKNSGVRQVFTPHQPISSLSLFWGRQREVQKLIEQINTPGQHALLYGDRGVGKSSLANIVCELILSKLTKGKFYPKRCDSSDTFETIVEAAIRDAGVEPLKDGHSKQVSVIAEGSVEAPFVSGKVGVSGDSTETFSAPSISPSFVALSLSKVTGLLMIDEADAIASDSDKKKLAELIKLLSDSCSPFKILVVGIAETGDKLTGGHPSVQRCLKETKLDRMKGDELSLIIRQGGKKLKLDFSEAVSQIIVRLSSGYPHFTHLLSLKCAENAIAEGRKHIGEEHIQAALDSAVEDAEGGLRRQYDNATRSHNTDMYGKVIHAAATISRVEFSSETLRTAIEKLTGDKITQGSLANYLNRLVGTDENSIFHRKAKGVYRFADPRMPSFVRIANHDIS